MKVKKKYIVICVILCLISVVINIGVFYIELNLSAYSKINSALTESWNKSEIFVTTVAKKEGDIREEEEVSYMGDVTYITNGKYPAYNAERWLSGTIPYYGRTKLGDKLKGYYKPDDPDRFEFTVPTEQYVTILTILIVCDVVLIIVCMITANIMKKPPKPKKTPAEKKAEKERKKAEKTKRKEEKKAAKAAGKAEKNAAKAEKAAAKAENTAAKPENAEADDTSDDDTEITAEADESAENPPEEADSADTEEDDTEETVISEEEQSADMTEETADGEKAEETAPEDTADDTVIADGSDDTVINGVPDSSEDGDGGADGSSEPDGEIPYYNAPETQDRSSVMDVPVCITVAGFVICMFMGMFGGYMSVGDNYTGINGKLVSEYERQANQYTYGYTENAE